jgi:hypothetical protein
MLTEALLSIPFFVIGQCSPVSHLIGYRENAQDLLVTGGSWYDFL